MKTSVISQEFRERFLSDPKKPNVFTGKAVVFEGPEDYHKRINSKKLKIDEKSILIMSFLREFWEFLRVRKKYWLLPILLVLVIFGGLIILTQGSAVAPFIYTIF